MDNKFNKIKDSSKRLNSYIIGFVLSILLTLGTYTLVTNHLLNGYSVMSVIAIFAVIQLIVQLIFFLHLRDEGKPRWNLLVFFFMLTVILIIVTGSLWIMNNLNYRMTPSQVNQYMNDQSGL